MGWRQTLVRIPVLGRLVLTAYRARQVWLELRVQLRHIPRWLISSREITNYTYELDAINEAYLAEFVAAVTGGSSAAAKSYMAELQQDTGLAEHVRHGAESSPERHMWDSGAHYGRRKAWYAIVRLRRPKVVIETGIDKGLGSCVLAAALLRNSAEGFPGRYYGTEIDTTKGSLFSEPYSSTGSIVFGDSITTLRDFRGQIDVFVNDSDHSSQYEAEEYRIIAPLLSPDAIVLGDNAHSNDELLKFAHETNRRFLFFDERPRDHWFRNAGIGAAFAERSTIAARNDGPETLLA